LEDPVTETHQAAIDTAHNGWGKGGEPPGVCLEHAQPADAARQSAIPKEARADRRTAEGKPCAQSLCDLQKDGQDNLGNTVKEILWRQTNYAIYRSDKGVYVHFSDSKEEEKDQRKRFTEICPELCELRYLTAQMKGSNWRPSFFGSRKHTLYDNNMAQALMLMMEGDKDSAKDIAHQTLAMAVRRVTADNTIRYVRTCLLWAGALIVIGVMAFWAVNHIGHAGATALRPYLVGGMVGAAGAVFSIVTRLEAFELKPCDESRMNYWMSAVRVLMGCMSAIALLLFADTLLGDMLGKLIGSGKHLTDPIGTDAKDVVLWQAVAMLGFVAGFAERLIPNIVRQTADKIESAVGTPVQAARNSPTRVQEKPANRAEEKPA
jgi:hypothetical protein